MNRAAAFVFCLCFLPILGLISCRTFQEDRAFSGDDPLLSAQSASLEEELVLLDGQILRGIASPKRELAQLRTNIREHLKSAGGNRMLEARLTALLGRVTLLEGNRAEADRLYQSAVRMSPGDTQVIILSVRLQNAPARRLEMLSLGMTVSDDNAPLALEQAVVSYELKEYAEAAAFFDSAFFRLPDFYHTAYNPLRETAWSLRDSSSSETAIIEYLTAPRLTYRGMILITQAETSLLDSITGAKKWSSRELMRKLAADDFFYSPAAREQDELTRVQCAWFLWSLYSRKRNDPMLKTRYTARFTARGVTKSPIPDIPVDEKVFDAVLGCVEQEFMELPDGIHFYPEQPVSGGEYLFWIKRLDR